MRLLDKITLWFIGVILLVTPVTMYISLNSIRKRMRTTEVARMKDVNDKVAQMLSAGALPSSFTAGRPLEVTTVSAIPAQTTETSEKCAYNAGLKQNECRLTVANYYNIGGQTYRISSYNYITKSRDIINGMLNAVVWKMILITLSVALTARLLSRIVFSPFRKTMKAIHQFNLRKKEKIQLPETSIKEFKELNTFLKKMTDKAVEDYASVKEFSENASHELQTPLAVLNSKLELMTETNIDETQAMLISDMQNAIEKLSRLNRSLILLTRVENQEFESTEQIKFCTIAREVQAIYNDRITLKNISITSDIDKNIVLNIHPTLAEMLMNNLLGNAIRHNVEGGSITMRLTQDCLTICNTGLPLQMPPEELFKRFKKSNQSAESIGLGLSIVKQICDVNGYSVAYTYSNELHTVTIHFAPQAHTAHITEPAPAPQLALS